MLDAAIIWIEANADLLGGIGTLCAATMFLFTNGRTLIQRVTPGGKAISIPSSTNDAGFIDAPLPAPEYGDRTAIGVLPFKELGDLPEHFTDGLLDDQIADLQNAGYATPTRAVIDRLKGHSDDPHSLARSLKVQYLLEGSIRRQESTFRIAVQLTSANGAIVWSDRFNMKGDDMMAMQDAIARRIAKSVEAHLNPPQEKIVNTVNRGNKTSYKTQDEACTARSVGASRKSRLTAFLLCLFVGCFGVHRYYIGRWFTGILYSVTIGFFGIGWMIDTILILCGVLTDRRGKRISQWLPQERPAQ